MLILELTELTNTARGMDDAKAITAIVKVNFQQYSTEIAKLMLEKLFKPMFKA